MNKVTVEFSREEATVVRFLLAGAPQMANVSPPSRLASQDALTKMDAAIAIANAPDPVPEQAAAQSEQA